jgi:hypothetical protein
VLAHAVDLGEQVLHLRLLEGRLRKRHKPHRIGELELQRSVGRVAFDTRLVEMPAGMGSMMAAVYGDARTQVPRLFNVGRCRRLRWKTASGDALLARA